METVLDFGIGLILLVYERGWSGSLSGNSETRVSHCYFCVPALP